MYFKSIIGRTPYCDSHVLSLAPLTSRLEKCRDDAELLDDHAGLLAVAGSTVTDLAA